MSTDQHPEILRRLLANASEQPPVAGPHLVDDDELLDRWADGKLNDTETNALLDHLDQCTYCRTTTARMLNEDLLQLPEIRDVQNEAQPSSDVPMSAVGVASKRPPATGPVSKSEFSRRFWAVAIAASLIGVALLLFSGRSPDEMALAQADLKANRASVALSRLEKLRRDRLSTDDAVRLQELAERAGYDLSGKSLAAADYEATQQVIDRVRQMGVDSARLANIELQAARRQPVESSLRRDDTLLKYQYDLQGKSLTKSLPVFEDQSSALEKRLDAAVSRYATDVQLRLNFGHFLLSLGKSSAAEQQFIAARDLAPDSADAFLGLGLAAFATSDFAAAARHFVQATELSPSNFAAQLNAAISLDRSNRGAEAQPYWQRAEESATDPQLKSLIAAQRRTQ